MTTPPDLESLRLLVHVAELGSVGRAARAMGIAQPSATKRLAALERRTGVPLLVRGPQGSTLTADGKLVVAWAATLLAAVGEFTESVSALRSSRSATLRIASSLTIAEALLPRWLSELRVAEPEVHVGLTVTNSTEVARLVLSDDEWDLGFVEGPTLTEGLASKVVGEDRLIVVVAPGHPWSRRRRPVLPAELAATPLVVRETGSGTRETLDRLLRAHDPVTPQLALGSNAAVTGAAVAGIAPAVLSRHAVETTLAAGSLVEVPVADLRLERRLRAVWPKGRRLSGPAATLLTIIANR
ncbi:LysR family transcriptional regulator [Actinophytocola xinjiangensis]|uniref:LysR family transcriptional regulator n=1 Tax=Actinophytocola xinjiangensis TaxID=485602 RepID=A0A7Z1AZW5_9PSEU|nr:LysR family transcriptional regulator [Actinophytocola xinjiangensis]OLF11658.1 LysR family transcriptional regulator [Actinophytocola xinjiangensis]